MLICAAQKGECMKAWLFRLYYEVGVNMNKMVKQHRICWLDRFSPDHCNSISIFYMFVSVLPICVHINLFWTNDPLQKPAKENLCLFWSNTMYFHTITYGAGITFYTAPPPAKKSVYPYYVDAYAHKVFDLNILSCIFNLKHEIVTYTVKSWRYSCFCVSWQAQGINVMAFNNHQQTLFVFMTE